MRHIKAIGVAALAAAAVSGALTAPARAAQSEDHPTCNGVTLTIRTNENNSSDKGGWSSVQILEGGSGHLIPVSFSGSLYDSVVQDVIFTFTDSKGGGHANHHQASTTCTEQFDATLGDFFQPGDELPPGTSLSDPVTFSFTATVIQRP
jgi:hypothetical protein